jgi:hypothetical protein
VAGTPDRRQPATGAGPRATLRRKGGRAQVPRRSRWLFREESLADASRNRFLRRLCSLRRRGKLVYKGRAALLADEVAWDAWRASLASQSWIVFSKLPPI